MISSSVMAFISSRVYPRYVNSFLRRVSTRPARFRNFLRAAFARPPIFFAMRSPPSSLLLQSLRFRGHPADLPAGWSVKSDGRRLADVLVRSASMRMVGGIHRDPADLEVGLAEGLEGKPFLAGLCEGLVPAARAGDRADCRAAIRMERSELARRQLDDGPISLAHDDGLRARGADEAAPVSRHRLEIVDEGPFGDLAQRHRVPAVEIRRAVGHRLPDGKPVARDHEHFVAIEPHPRERGRVARRLEDGGHDAGAAEMRVHDRTRMAVARRPIRRRGPAAAALARKVLAHQNTPIRIPISSAENSGLSLMIACLPSLRTNVLTFSTLTWNRSSNAFLTWSLVARRITRNSRRFPSFRF